MGLTGMLIAVLVVGGVGYFFYKKQEDEGDNENEEQEEGASEVYSEPQATGGRRLKRVKLKQERIADQWSTLIEGANGKGEKVITDTMRAIENVNAPNVFISRKEVRPGNAGFIRIRREFLVAEHRQFDTYDMYIGARDYGKQLFVSWYLVAQPISFWRLFKRNPLRAILTAPFVIFARGISRTQGGSGDLFSSFNLFDIEELTAYVTTVHHALLDSVKIVMEGQKLDFTKVEKRTKGFLNVV